MKLYLIQARKQSLCGESRRVILKAENCLYSPAEKAVYKIGSITARNWIAKGDR